jgi:hypothetical protein
VTIPESTARVAEAEGVQVVERGANVIEGVDRDSAGHDAPKQAGAVALKGQADDAFALVNHNAAVPAERRRLLCERLEHDSFGEDLSSRSKTHQPIRSGVCISETSLASDMQAHAGTRKDRRARTRKDAQG